MSWMGWIGLPVTRSSRNSRLALLITAMPGMTRPILLDVHQSGQRQVIVPQVMAQRLEVPEILAGGGVHRDQGIGEERRALPVIAGLVEGRRAERANRRCPRFSSRITPVQTFTPERLTQEVALPGLMEFLRRLRHSVEMPDFFARPDVEGPYPSRGSLLRRFLGPRPRNDRGSCKWSGRRSRPGRRWEALQHRLAAQADHAVRAEAPDRRASMSA